MGIVDEINALELDDDVKQRLIREHEGEVNPLRTENTTLKSRSRREQVEQEVENLKSLGFAEAPGLLKFVRRALLSDDEEPGLVMLSDNELDLSGDTATGATGREEITTANALRKVFELMPKTEEGKLKIALSEQGLVGDGDNPPDEGAEKSDDEKRQERKQSAESWAGRPLTRSRNRYRRGGVPAASGGDA